VSEHADSKNSTVAAIIIALIICGLVVWGISLMNNGNLTACAIGGGLLFLFSLYIVLTSGRTD
jgi:hypothetical protein